LIAREPIERRPRIHAWLPPRFLPPQVTIAGAEPSTEVISVCSTHGLSCRSCLATTSCIGATTFCETPSRCRRATAVVTNHPCVPTSLAPGRNWVWPNHPIRAVQLGTVRRSYPKYARLVTPIDRTDTENASTDSLLGPLWRPI
jgi:hypothetical protein